MRVLMKRSLTGEDRTDWLTGEIHDASESYARYLIGRDDATLVTEPVTTADPIATHRDPVSPRSKR